MEKTGYPYKLTTPVVFMVFNRPAKTRRVFDAIKMARPTKLLIIADGPRNSEDETKCQQVREIIEAGVDWPCEVLKNYSDKNLRPKLRISSGLDWVFSQVEEAIILEDDCLPDQSFFPFCQELLEKYRDEPRIMQISGYNFVARNKKLKCEESYYFSNISSMSGWASWRRAWNYFDVNIKKWPEVKKSGLLNDILKDFAVIEHYNHLLDDYYAQKVDSWDTQWNFARYINGGICAISKNNLIQNIGFDSEAANRAIDPNDPRAHVPIKATEFPLIHPDKIIVKPEFDAYMFKYLMGINLHFGQKVRNLAKKRVPRIYRFLKKLKS